MEYDEHETTKDMLERIARGVDLKAIIKSEDERIDKEDNERVGRVKEKLMAGLTSKQADRIIAAVCEHEEGEFVGYGLLNLEECVLTGGESGGSKYCNKFNDECREHNRDKYDRECFICGKDESDNSRRLSVHHVDMNKDQGCDGEKWKLVPLCQSCHSRAHSELWQARIEYLLSSDKQ